MHYVTEVVYEADYRLCVSFDDGGLRIVDF